MPSINRREVNTAVLVEDGQTVVIGGVYEFTDRSSISKVPFLGDIPIVGTDLAILEAVIDTGADTVAVTATDDIAPYLTEQRGLWQSVRRGLPAALQP